MPRRPRIVVEGVAHHVTQRGNNRQAVFHSDHHRFLYLELLRSQSARYGMRILGYCLMSNHVHLVVVPTEASSLARALGRTHAEYALALNRTEGRSGHVWQNRFFSSPLDARHLLRALQYVELNPVRAGLVPQAWDWPWSSARAHIREAPVDPMLDSNWRDHLGGWDFAGWRECLLAGLADSELKLMRRAWRTGEPLGSQEFTAELEERMGRRLRVLARGRPRKPAEAPAPEARYQQQQLFLKAAL